MGISASDTKNVPPPSRQTPPHPCAPPPPPSRKRPPPAIFDEDQLGGHFGPEKMFFAPPLPLNSPTHRRHPPSPSTPPVLEGPPPGILNENRCPHPLPAPWTPPSALPEQKKIKNIRNVHQAKALTTCSAVSSLSPTHEQKK